MTGMEGRLGDLRNYQRVGVEFLASGDGVLLADEMGTGKTVQAACALELLRTRGQLRRALVVVPASLKLNWYRELREWAPGCSVRLLEGNHEERRVGYMLPVHLLVASYEQVAADFMTERPSVMFDVLILDEAQRVKNPANRTTLAVTRVERRRIWALTGTPLENRVEELQTIIRIIRPDIRTGVGRAQVLRSLEGHFLRRRKSDVLEEMPEIVDKTVHLELNPVQRSVYDETWMRRREIAVQQDSHLAVITQLKQLCNFEPETGDSVKLEALATIIHNAAEEDGKVLVFSQYVQSLEMVADQLDFPTAIYHGGLDIEQRDAILTAFRADIGSCALLVSLRAGGVGLNVQEATHVVLFDRWWNPQLEDQAVHRAHRYGRQVPLLVYRFLVRDTVEERIVSLLHQKRELFSEYVEGAAAEGEATEEVLRRLLEL